MCGTLLGYYLPSLFHTLHIALSPGLGTRNSRTALRKSYHSSHCKCYCILLFICPRRTDAMGAQACAHPFAHRDIYRIGPGTYLFREICATSRILGRRHAQLARWLGNHERLRSPDRMFLKSVRVRECARVQVRILSLWKNDWPPPFLADKIGWKSGTRDLSSIQDSRTGSGQNWVDRRCGVPGIPDSRDYGILFASKSCFLVPFIFPEWSGVGDAGSTQR